MDTCEQDAGLHLVAIERDGRLAGTPMELPAYVSEMCEGTARMYGDLGFVPPWIGYVSVHDGRVVGGGAFVGAPAQGRVEIAYFTVPEFEGRGMAGLTARCLVALARRHAPDVDLFAKTMPEHNASTRILQRLGFVHAGVAPDHEIGEAWAWLLPAAVRNAP